MANKIRASQVFRTLPLSSPIAMVTRRPSLPIAMETIQSSVPAGPATIEIVESTLPDGAVQTVGTDPSTVDITDGGTITEVDGFYFPTDAPTKAPTASPTASPTAHQLPRPLHRPPARQQLRLLPRQLELLPELSLKMLITMVNKILASQVFRTLVSSSPIAMVTRRPSLPIAMETIQSSCQLDQLQLISSRVRLPDGAVQTVGTNPSTVDITDGGTITEVDGFYFPTDAPTKAPTASPTASPTDSPTDIAH